MVRILTQIYCHIYMNKLSLENVKHNEKKKHLLIFSIINKYYSKIKVNSCVLSNYTYIRLPVTTSDFVSHSYLCVGKSICL